MKHILLADDEQNMLLTMQFILEISNYKVTIAENGQEALNKILELKNSNNPVDLLVTDIQMPCLTGMELIEKLNSLGTNIPVLAISGYGNEDLVAELKSKGCDDYLDKPFNEDDLLNRVSRLLNK